MVLISASPQEIAKPVLQHCFRWLDIRKKFKQKPKHMMLLLIAGTHCANLAHSMLNLINSYRSQDGLRPLRSIQNLEDAAKDQALYMCEKSILTHENPGGSLKQRVKRHGFKGLSIGENIAKNHGDGYVEVGRMWMVSQGHRKNIMGDFAYSGIATCLDENGNRYWVQVFGGEGQGEYEKSVPADNRVDGPFLSSDEPILDGLKDDCDNPESLDRRYSEDPSSGGHGGLRLGNNARIGRTLPNGNRRSKLPGLSFKSRGESPGVICFNIDDCTLSQSASAFSSMPNSSVVSKLTVTQMKTSYIPVSSIVYKTMTETVSLSASTSYEKPPVTQTVFMIINTSVPAISTVVTTTPTPNETSTTSSSQIISTVTVTTSSIEPIVVNKTITVTETPEPRKVTVTVTSRSTYPASVVSVEKTVTAAPSQPSSKVVTVVERRIPMASLPEAQMEVPSRIKLKVAHVIPEAEPDRGLEYVARYGETRAPIYETIALPLASDIQEYPRLRGLLMPKDRAYSRQEGQNDEDAEMQKYPGSGGYEHQYLGAYYIGDTAASKAPLGAGSESKPRDQAQYLNNPCGGQNNPCVRTILLRR